MNRLKTEINPDRPVLMQRIFFGITTFMLTSAFFTQMVQEKAFLPVYLGWDWKIQFCLELAIGTVATFLGVQRKKKSAE